METLTRKTMACFIRIRTRIAAALKEGNVLFNDALSTFYLRLYGVRHMVKNHSDCERGNVKEGRKKMFLFNDALNTFYLWL